MAWQDGLARIPLFRLILGVVAGWGMTVGVCTWLLMVPGFVERVRIDVDGQVEEVRTPEVMDHPVLDVTLRGQTVRFRAGTRVFNEVFHEHSPAELRPGANARLTVEKVKYEKPFSPMPDRVPTVSIDAMQVDGVDLLTLGVAQRLDDANRNMAKILVPIAAVIAVFLSWCLRLKLRQRS